MERKHPLARCEECPLFSGGTFSAPSALPQGRKVLLITGAPTNEEAFKNFFDTKGGKLTKGVLNHAGVDPSSCGHTTAVMCRPGMNDKVTPSAVSACRPALVDRVEAAQPEMVVAMGSDAVLSVMGAGAVTKLRVGQPKKSPHLSMPVIPTVSPYQCMRQESQFPNFVTDIHKLTSPAPVFIEPEYEVIDDAYSAEKYLDWCLTGDPEELVIDIEVDIDKDSSFGHPEHYGMLCVGVAYGDDRIRVFTANALTSYIWNVFAKLLRRAKLVAQNGKFDLNGIRPQVGKQELFFDTMLASYVFDERSGVHGLKYMAQEYLGAPNYDAVLDQYVGKGAKKSYGNIPKPILYKYNAYDVHCTRELRKMFGRKFEEEPTLLHLHNMLVEISNMLADVEYHGMAVDRMYLDNLDTYYTAKLAELKQSVAPINPNSPLQVKKFLLDNGIKVATTDAAMMEKVHDHPDVPKEVKDYIEVHQEFKTLGKLHGTYVKGIDERLHKGRVHSTYLIHGTTTGRLSSRNPNLQNIPRISPIKHMFVPSSEELVLIQSDYSQAELRTITWLAKDEYFRGIFNEGAVDVFDDLTPKLYDGASKQDFSEEQWKEMRTMVKTYVYGLSYGRTEWGIARGFGIPVETARLHMQRFFSVIPKIIEWQQGIKETVMRMENLVTPFGRQRRYALLTDENIDDVMNEALAFVPQSTASDICLTAAIDLRKFFLDNRFDWTEQPHIVNLVHDSIMVEAHEDDAEFIKELMEQLMIHSATRVVGDYVKFAVGSSIARNWGDLK